MSRTKRPVVDMLVAMASSRDAESARCARLLHDEVGQILSAVGLHLGVLRMDFQGQTPEIASRVTEIQNMLERAIEHVRELSYELNPQIVERAGLHAALDRLAGRFRAEFSGHVRLLYDPAVRAPVESAAAMYRIAEQALENAVRHSGATTIEILVRATQSGTSLEVRDNGGGFHPQEARESEAGIGLILMRHYAAEDGLELSVNSSVGKGTIVRVLRRLCHTTSC